MHRKGFIQIAEIIIIVLVAFAVVAQLQTLPAANTDWTPAKLEAAGTDLLAALDAAGVDWFNASDILRIANRSFPEEALLGLSLKGPAKTTPRIACICSDAETSALTAALQPFLLNRRTVTFAVEQIAESGLSPVTDATVLFSHSPAVPALFFDYLRSGRGLVQIRDLTPTELTQTQRELFGTGISSLAPAGGFSLFIAADNATSPFYPLFAYYNNTPAAQPLPDTIPGFLSPAERAAAVPPAQALLVEKATGAPALIVRQEGAGRTGWLSAAPVSLVHSQLVRALVLWAAGDEQTILTLPPQVRNPVLVSRFTSITGDMQELAEIRLRLGTAF